MTVDKIMKAYLYEAGEWTPLDFEYNPWAGDIAFGTHDEPVEMRAYPDDGSDGLPVVVDPGVESTRTSHFSAASKWGYAHAALYGNPKNLYDPYVAVLEIAEDAFPGTYEPLSPHPYMVVFRLAFGETVVFADSTPDLVRLLHELLPLVTPAPSGPDIYGLHEWGTGGRRGV